ncbi:MAG: hypothetical protein BYD32DRAFT_467387 [Podila humilis]|nr:MAG: hypothetical protein BYD32DRAFT_467387 [Podila humilis]
MARRVLSSSTPSIDMSPTPQQQPRTLRSRPSLIFLVLSLISLLSLFSTPIDAALAVRADATTDLHYDTWDPFQGLAPQYSLSGVLVLGVVQKNCTVRVPSAAGPAGQAILGAVDPANPITTTIVAIEYDWLDYCATYDDIFDNLPDLNAHLKSLNLPEVGAVVMDGDAQSTEDFGAPFIQLAEAKKWNQKVRLNISFTGSDSIVALSKYLGPSASAPALLATVEQMDGPWNELWSSIGFIIVIRGLDVLAGLIFLYGLWVLAFILKAKHESQHFRRYMILIPGCIYLPLSIVFAPYKVQVPWRNAVYYLSLLFPFISLGLQITMWSKLIYRIKRKTANKLFSYFSYVTIFVPVISSFLDGIGWLIPGVPIIRMIGEKGFSFATPAVILVQAGLIFYYATTFFKSLKGVAVSQTTRTALIKITVLNLAMISFFILMLLSRIVSLMGLNMRNRAAYMTELIIFRFSFLFFYAACFRTLSIRQPTGSTVDSKGASNSGHHSNTHPSKNQSKNHTHYNMDEFSNNNHTGSNHKGSRHDTESRPSLHYNKHLSNHASKGFTISDPSAAPPPTSPKISYVPHVNQLNAGYEDGASYPDPYKFNEFGHLTHYTHGERGSNEQDDEDKHSVYGSHRFPAKNSGGVVPLGKTRNSEGYLRFDTLDEDRRARAI